MNWVPVEQIHTYLVFPTKGEESPEAIHGSEVPLEGKLFTLMSEVYERSDSECTIDISFNQSAGGNQSNPCRSLILTHLGGPTLDTGRSIADRLGLMTTRRSGLGLVFLVLGTEGRHRKIVLSRFPAHSAILAEAKRTALSIEFLERVFMKSAFSYKAAVYRDISLTNGFWYGKAVDRQLRAPDKETADYWIKDFLDSDFRTTPARGTRRLAEAMKKAAQRTDDLTIKSQIASAVTLAGGLDGQNTSVIDFIDRFGLAPTAKEAIIQEFKDPEILAEHFTFTSQVFDEQLPYRSIELDTGAILTAPAPDFEDVFVREPIEGEEGEYRYSATGSVVNERVAKTRR